MQNDDKMIAPQRRTPDPLLEPTSAQPPARGYGYGYGYAGAREEASGLNVRELWRIVAKNKWLILTLVLVVTTVVSLAAFKVQSRYRAEAVVQIEDPNQSGVFKEGESVYVAFGSDKYYRTQLKLLQMPALARKVALELDLENNPNFFSAKPASLMAAVLSLVRPSSPPPATASRSDLGLSLDPNRPVDEATAKRLTPYVETILGGLSVQEVPSTQLIAIAFEHHDPEIAAKVANSIAETFVRDNLNKRVNSKASASDFLQRRIAELQASIRSGEERLVNYARSHEILGVDPEQNPSLETLSALNADLVKVRTELQQLEAMREAMRQVGETDIMRWPIAQADTGAQEVLRQLNAARSRKAELLQTFTEEYPAVKEVSEQIVMLEEQLARVRDRLSKQAEAQYQEAMIRERKLRESLEEQRASMMEQNEDSIQYKMLQQEVETNRAIYQELLERQKQVDITAASENNNVHIKDIAPVPERPIGPDRSRWILLGLLASLAGGLGIAFGREYLDQTIKSLEDIDRAARLPSLGVIPALSAGAHRGRRRRLTASAGGPRPSAELITSLDSRSSAAEAYRQLRTSVLLSSAGHPSRVLLVTSSQPREGKTTTAVNTAISLAQTGASVLIVDCDMRKPRVHQLLNVPSAVGASLYLSGQCEDLQSLIQKHQIPNLYVLPCGPIPPNPAELLGSDQMRKLLETLQEHFDHVVVDSPPVISFADPVILSTMVDGVILVVRGGFTSKGIIARSRQILGDVGAKIYGVVLNDADMKSSGSYYYDYENYYYTDDDSNAKGAGAG